MSEGYFVALRYCEHVEGYAGIITWTQFSSKSAFDNWYRGQNEKEVVEEGITPERCVELTKSTPMGAYTECAYHRATDPVTGEINSSRLQYELTKFHRGILAK